MVVDVVVIDELEDDIEVRVTVEDEDTKGLTFKDEDEEELEIEEEYSITVNDDVSTPSSIVVSVKRPFGTVSENPLKRKTATNNVITTNDPNKKIFLLTT